MTPDAMTTFRCPFCGFVSPHLVDGREGYCVRCHVFVDDVFGASPIIRRAMGRFCRRLAEVHPDQAEQALRTAAVWEHGL